MPVKYTHLILLNAWAEQTPLLGKALPRSIQSGPAGQRQNTQESAPSKTKDLSAQFLERGLGFPPTFGNNEMHILHRAFCPRSSSSRIIPLTARAISLRVISGGLAACHFLRPFRPSSQI